MKYLSLFLVSTALLVYGLLFVYGNVYVAAFFTVVGIIGASQAIIRGVEIIFKRLKNRSDEKDKSI